MPKPILLSIAVALLVFVSCSKKNVNSNSSTWTFNGKTYSASTAGYDSADVYGLLDAQDPSGDNGITIGFNSLPTVNGPYIVTRGVLGPGYPANNCALHVFGNSSGNYISIGKPGDVVNVTISNGKIHASFSNITIENGSDTTTVSGTIIQVTYE
jgi:hypothetical protein